MKMKQGSSDIEMKWTMNKIHTHKNTYDQINGNREKSIRKLRPNSPKQTNKKKKRKRNKIVKLKNLKNYVT